MYKIQLPIKYLCMSYIARQGVYLYKINEDE